MKVQSKIIAPIVVALLAFSSAEAQESPTPRQENRQIQVNLQLADEAPDNNQFKQNFELQSDRPQVKELEARPRGRSRIEPAPAPRPIIEVKKL